MKIKIVYFAYLAPDKWENIVVEHLDSLKKIDLYASFPIKLSSQLTFYEKY